MTGGLPKFLGAAAQLLNLRYRLLAGQLALASGLSVIHQRTLSTSEKMETHWFLLD
jgi:hypothetical protein